LTKKGFSHPEVNGNREGEAESKYVEGVSLRRGGIRINGGLRSQLLSTIKKGREGEKINSRSEGKRRLERGL